MYIIQQADPGATAYNMAQLYMFREEIQRETWAVVFNRLIDRHESLRTTFHMVDGEPVQRIHDRVEFSLENYDAPGGPETIIDEFIRPFDLEAAPLVRAASIKTGERGGVLLVDMHHIISDGISMNILMADAVRLKNGQTLPQPLLRYRDYAEWINGDEQQTIIARQEEYWRRCFGDFVPELLMPQDFQRPRQRTFEGSVIRFDISPSSAEALNRLAQRQDVTLNIVLFAIYSLLLNRYTGQDDMVIGSLTAGRDHESLEGIVGVFANFLPIRIKLDAGSRGETTFIQHLDTVTHALLDAYANRDYPFDKMVERLRDQLIPFHNPLFDTMLLVHNEGVVQTGDTAGSDRYGYEWTASALDFKMDIFITGGNGLSGRLEYNTALFKAETMGSFINRFQRLIDQIAEEPEQRIPVGREANAPAESPLNTVISATFTAEPVGGYIKWWGNEYGMAIDVEFAPYHQVFQQLLDEGSQVSCNSGINVLLVRLEDWIRHDDAPDDEKCRKLERNVNELLEILSNKRKTVPYFIGWFPLCHHLFSGNRAPGWLEELNKRWRQRLEALDNVYVMDFTELKDLYDVTEIFDPVKDEEAHMPFSDEFYAAMGTFIARKIYAYNNQTYKVIALDCDNTLWKGICGEDGPLGVEVSEPYRRLQEFMLTKYHEGMLLVLCSKNNEEDVWEVFQENPGMCLKREHFVDWKINWQPKSQNLEELARQLNLGVDSFIFLDDSAVECSEVESNCPGVLSLQLPGDPGDIPMFLRHVWVFDRLKVTEEDKKRSSMYAAERKRRQLRDRTSSSNMTDFLAKLELSVDMRPLQERHIPRAAQLTQRTNQFNLSTIRRQEQDIRDLLQDSGAACWTVHVSDRFGDYGLVGVAIAREMGDCLFIDTFLLSCRVLGRTVEDAILVGLKNYCETIGVKTIKAAFYPTPKNKPFLEFIKRTCWENAGEAENFTTFRLAIDNIPRSIDYIDCKYNFFNVEAAPRQAAELPRRLKGEFYRLTGKEK
jgi:FkbH-like protein